MKQEKKVCTGKTKWEEQQWEEADLFQNDEEFNSSNI